MRTVCEIMSLIVSLPVLCFGSSQFTSLNCIARTELPRYAVVSVVRGTSTVNAAVVIGAEGKAEKVEITADQQLSGDEVKYHLTELTTYKEECLGKTINLTFKFVFSGRASYSPNIRTFFVAPATFVIEADLGKSDPKIVPLK